MKLKKRKFQYICIVIGTSISLNASVWFQNLKSRGPYGPYDPVGDRIDSDVSPVSQRERRSVRPQWEEA